MFLQNDIPPPLAHTAALIAFKLYLNMRTTKNFFIFKLVSLMNMDPVAGFTTKVLCEWIINCCADTHGPHGDGSD